MQLFRPLVWAYIMLGVAVLGFTVILIARTQDPNTYLTVSLVSLGVLFATVGIFTLTWVVNAILLFRQIRKGNGTFEVLARRINDFNLPAGQWELRSSTKLEDKWRKNKPVL